MPNPWYPERSHFATYEQWDAHVQALNLIYDHKAKLDKAIEDIKKVAKVAQSNVGQTGGGPLNTTIVGLAVTPGQPANGQTIRFDTASGQWKFGV